MPNESLNKSFGKRIKDERLKRKLTQEGLIKEAKLDATIESLANWENGRNLPRLEEIAKLSSFFDISLDYLLLGKPENAKNIEIKTIKDAFRCLEALRETGVFEFHPEVAELTIKTESPLIALCYSQLKEIYESQFSFSKADVLKALGNVPESFEEYPIDYAYEKEEKERNKRFEWEKIWAQ